MSIFVHNQFVVTDLLPHLDRKQGKKTLEEAVVGENLNLLIGSLPFGDAPESDAVKLNILRLLNLPSEVRKLVNENKLTYTQARALLALEDEDRMAELANEAVKQGLSVKELEKLCADKKKKPNKNQHNKHHGETQI